MLAEFRLWLLTASPLAAERGTWIYEQVNRSTPLFEQAVGQLTAAWAEHLRGVEETTPAPAPAPVSPAAPTRKKGKKQKQIEDAGEYLPGARKHMWTPGAQIEVTDLEAIEAQPAGTIHKYLTKQYVFGPFPWGEEKEAGVTAEAASLKSHIWRCVAQRPGEGPDARRLYVAGAAWLKEQLAPLRTGPEVRDFIAVWYEGFMGGKVDPLRTPRELIDHLGLTLPHDSGPPTGGATWTVEVLSPEVKEAMAAARKEGLKAIQDLTQMRLPAAEHNALQSQIWERIHATARLMTLPHTARISARDLRARGYSHLARSGVQDANGDYQARLVVHPWGPYQDTLDASGNFIVGNPKSYLFGLAGFGSATQSKEIRKQQLVKLVTTRPAFSNTVLASAQAATWETLLADTPQHEREKPWQRATTHQRRLGPKVHIPATLYGDEFVRAFEFRGDQFGESVTQEERAKHRLYAWEAFADLARIAEVPLNAISACGRLGISFGARGHGTASAHYEAINNVTLQYFPVINLTNTRGDGSLAHEWAHFIDHHLTRGRENVFEGSGGLTVPYLSGGRAARQGTGWTPELYEAMATVLRAMNTPDLETRKKLTEEREKFIAAVNVDLQKLNADVRSGKITREEYTAQWAVTRARAKHAPSYTQTRYANDAETLGEYWMRPTEMFARAFESFIEDELAMRGEENTYLVFGTRKKYEHYVMRNKVRVGPLEPYPQGSERERINRAIRALLTLLRDTPGALCR